LSPSPATVPPDNVPVSKMEKGDSILILQVFGYNIITGLLNRFAVISFLGMESERRKSNVVFFTDNIF
jgi:hypothetical protein